MNSKFTSFIVCICFIYLISLASIPCPTCESNVAVTHVSVYDSPPSLDRMPTECIRSRDIWKEWKIETFVACADIAPDPDDVSILVQLSYDRLNILAELAGMWQGPMSVVTYLEMDEYHLAEYIKFHDNHEYLRKFSDFHIIYVEDGLKYPVNPLRNVALLNSRTSFVLTLDVDFIPNPNMHMQLKTAASEMKRSKDALVIPAFEVPRGNFPSTKTDLIKLTKSGAAYQVHFYKGIHAHSPTDYDRWYNAESSYEVQYEYSYEPYYVVRRSVCPLFDERFIGYGNDKTSHAYELAVSGFNFVVLPDPFIIHKNHPSPAWRSDQGSSDSWRLWAGFTRSMEYKYGNRVDVPEWLKDACNQGDCPQFWLYY